MAAVAAAPRTTTRYPDEMTGQVLPDTRSIQKAGTAYGCDRICLAALRPVATQAATPTPS